VQSFFPPAVGVIENETANSETRHTPAATAKAALNYCARRYDPAICCSSVSKNGHVAAASIAESYLLAQQLNATRFSD